MNIEIKREGLVERMFIMPYVKKMVKKKLGIQPDLNFDLTCKGVGEDEISFNLVVEGKISRHDLEKLKVYLLNN